MIRSEKEYKEAVERLRKDEEVLALQREKLKGLELSEEEVGRALDPMLSFRAQLEEEVEWYERVRRRDFGILRDLSAVGTLLIAMRIANGLSQRELAEILRVSEAQVSRDERNEYHGITVDRAQRVLDAMGETLSSRVEDKPLALA
ncbi:helix-turn-helix domain-containing protein [Rubrobacter radiotolerans]|uniref:Helix-turn-helix domain-containing protein n=1 Tax=Rubrobacter radiotolerans TaxID=42256 RepID=A0AB35T6M9_RUBRA|nr:helix-turn-helix domain-containing protein [Rubrobacter radiotolerans]MDX5895207.1 helix-turn-helix domain-containing protein [Rubrobacter radiotolerans]SMC07648.1 Helix-turn-helix [Rubrobacter radiotolerans DSM 5868]